MEIEEKEDGYTITTDDGKSFYVPKKNYVFQDYDQECLCISVYT